MKTCEEYVIKRLEELEKQNEKLKKENEELLVTVKEDQKLIVEVGKIVTITDDSTTSYKKVYVDKNYATLYNRDEKVLKTLEKFVARAEELENGQE